MDIATRFNVSAFGQWINSPVGRVFRIVAGAGFLVLGLALGSTPAGVAAVAWGLAPLSAGLLDVCWISASLGGPLRGASCRSTLVRQ
jgi:hypothetical protein